MIKAIIFDCFGVLYSEGKTYIESLCPAEKKADLDDLYNQADYGYISTEHFFKEVSHILKIDQAELADINTSQHVRNQPLIELLKIYKKEYKTGLLSNVSDSFFDSLFTPKEQADLFDDIVLSSSIGAVKPHPQAYEAIADKLAVKPEECIMIDDILVNCNGARQVGMQAIHYKSVQDTKQQLKQLFELQ